MAVKKAKEASFKKMDSAFATSQSAIQKVKNTDPLNGNEEQDDGHRTGIAHLQRREGRLIQRKARQIRTGARAAVRHGIYQVKFLEGADGTHENDVDKHRL